MTSVAYSGRPSESDALSRAVGGRGPALVVVRGPSAAGRRSLLAHALAERGTAWYAATALPDSAHRRGLAQSLATWDPAVEGPEAESWSALFEAVLVQMQATARPLVLVIEGAEHVGVGRSGFAAALAELWTGARGRALPLFVVLSARSGHGLQEWLHPQGSLSSAITLDLTLSDLGPDEVAQRLPGWSALDRLRAWAALGGRPERIEQIDPRTRLQVALKRAVLHPSAPLHRRGETCLAEAFQQPRRYAGLVGALARGARDWSELREAVPEFATGGQLAPYLASLEEHELIDVERSLDARPRSRRRRYTVSDPFVSFWHRCVLPRLGELDLRGPDEAWRSGLYSALDGQAAEVLPRACRSVLARHAGRILGSPVREVGALWGDHYDLPVAGTLRSGAPFYGVCVWGRPALPGDADQADAALRATRYGFGREARLRVVFAAGGVSESLRRRAAREDLLRVVPLEELLDT